MDEGRECDAEIFTDIECCLVKADQEEKIERHHAEGSVFHNLNSGA